jgi:hypothetical protein
MLVGCSTAPKGVYEIDNSGAIKNDEGVIAVCRPSGFVASGISPDVLINGEIVAELGSGGALEILSKTGKLNLQFKSATFPKPNTFGISFKLDDGATKYFLMAPNLDSLLALPISGFVVSGVRVRWQVAEASRAIFEEKCSGIKRLRLKSANK